MPSEHHLSPSAIEVKNPSAYMTLTYTLSLTLIAALSIVVHMVLDRVISEQSQTAHTVNISGQQRMLSQRASMFALDYLASGDSAEKRLAEQAIERIQHNHRELLQQHRAALTNNRPSPLSAPLQDLYFAADKGVEPLLEQFTDSIAQALSQPMAPGVTNHSYAFFELAKDPLLQRLDDVVNQYEAESLARVDDLLFAQRVVLCIIILTILLEALFIFRPMVSKVSKFANRLQYEANHDHLSGLFNRRAFTLLANKILANAKRQQRNTSLIMVDIDHFKKINDTHGHDIGDLCIQTVAGALQQQLRSADILARLGGEEFAVLLPETTAEQALLVAEKLRQAIAALSINTQTQPLTLTASFGVSACSDSQNPLEQALKQADEALYSAKQAGRNQVHMAPSPV